MSGEKERPRLDDLETNNAKARAQVDAVLSPLEALLEAPPEKLRDAYDQYDRDVKKIHDYADRIRENDADLKKNGDNYLKKWQKDASSISDPKSARASWCAAAQARGVLPRSPEATAGAFWHAAGKKGDSCATLAPRGTAPGPLRRNRALARQLNSSALVMDTLSGFP